MSRLPAGDGNNRELIRHQSFLRPCQVLARGINQSLGRPPVCARGIIHVGDNWADTFWRRSTNVGPSEERGRFPRRPAHAGERGLSSVSDWLRPSGQPVRPPTNWPWAGLNRHLTTARAKEIHCCSGHRLRHNQVNFRIECAPHYHQSNG